MKAVFVGQFECERFGFSELVRLLKKYEFDTIYLHSEVYFLSEHFKDFNVFLWVNYHSEELESIYNKLIIFDNIKGVLLDGVRVLDDEFGLFGLLNVFNTTLTIRDVSKRLSVLGMELQVCFKQEDYVSVSRSELNRLLWSQSICLVKKWVNKVLLMGYHQTYGVGLDKVVFMVNALRKKHGNKVVPIWQTFQDIPFDYNIYWKEVKAVSGFYSDKIFFRFGTCDLKTFE